MAEIIKINNLMSLKNDLVKYEVISFTRLLVELGLVVPSRIINRSQVSAMLEEGSPIVTMNYTYFMKRDVDNEGAVKQQLVKAGIL